MESIDIWYKDGWGQDEKQEMSSEEIGTPKRELNDLHNEFSGRL